MAKAQFTSYLGPVRRGMERQAAAALEVIGGKAETYAKLNAPVDTGRLRNSITHQMLDQKSVMVGTNVKYAPYVELGSGKPRKRGRIPYLKPAVEEHTEEYKRILDTFLRT